VSPAADLCAGVIIAHCRRAFFWPVCSSSVYFGETGRLFRLKTNAHFDTAELTLSRSTGCFWSEPRQCAPSLAVMQSSRWG